jgi:hypothetical protein
MERCHREKSKAAHRFLLLLLFLLRAGKGSCFADEAAPALCSSGSAKRAEILSRGRQFKNVIPGTISEVPTPTWCHHLITSSEYYALWLVVPWTLPKYLDPYFSIIKIDQFPEGQKPRPSNYKLTRIYGIAKTMAPNPTIIIIMGFWNIASKLNDSWGTK